ncbi:MAG: endolytic transglycosylase MltG [Bacilli bacterium]
MKLFNGIAQTTVIILIVIILLLGTIYNFLLSPVSRNDELVIVEIAEGLSSIQIAEQLKKQNLIKDVFIFLSYLKLNNIKNLQAGEYYLSESMGVKKITQKLSRGEVIDYSISITFPEGINMRHIAAIIEKETNNTKEDVFNLLKDERYIASLIDQYWFLTDEIKNKDIYYPLEGYLFPNTYKFKDKDVTVSEIFTIMLQQMGKVLLRAKASINKTDYTIHQFLTLASIVQSEGLNNRDMGDIAGVFYNRLARKRPLESCVTACYAMRNDTCTASTINTKIISLYNTYLTNMGGKLPVGPISNPGDVAIQAVIHPKEHQYLYFLSDKYGHTYFFKTYQEHQKKQRELEAKGDWLK